MSTLISEHYQEQQKQLHASNPNYGMASVQFAPTVSRLINQFHVTHLLDYGAGKGRLAQHLKPNQNVHMQQYDPAIPGFSKPPTPSEMVCCIDVLEHIEPDYLMAVLDNLSQLTQKIGFFTIHTGPAMKCLPDGRNAHLIQQPLEWWLLHIIDRFQLFQVNRFNMGFLVIVMAKTVDINYLMCSNTPSSSSNDK